MTSGASRTLLIGCGALAREILAVLAANGWGNFELACLPADLHNRPSEIPEAVRRKIVAARPHYDQILVVYGDCGTGGRLDAMLLEEGVERIAGPHCYEFFSGTEIFTAYMEEEPGTLFLTDYMVRHFDRLIIQGLGLDRYPELLSTYFGNYRRVVYLAQNPEGELANRAQEAARRLGLSYQYHETGLGGLANFLHEKSGNGTTDDRILA